MQNGYKLGYFFEDFIKITIKKGIKFKGKKVPCNLSMIREGWCKESATSSSILAALNNCLLLVPAHSFLHNYGCYYCCYLELSLPIFLFSDCRSSFLDNLFRWSSCSPDLRCFFFFSKQQYPYLLHIINLVIIFKVCMHVLYSVSSYKILKLRIILRWFVGIVARSVWSIFWVFQKLEYTFFVRACLIQGGFLFL